MNLPDSMLGFRHRVPDRARPLPRASAVGTRTIVLAASLGLAVLYSAPRALAEEVPEVDPAAASEVAVLREKAAAPFAFLGDAKRREQITARYEAHRAAREHAWEWLDDTERYPVPAKAYTGWVPGSDVQPGHDEMEVRVSHAVVEHNELIATLARHLRLRTEAVGDRRATSRPHRRPAPKVGTYGFHVLGPGLDRWLERYLERYDAYAARREEVYGPIEEALERERSKTIRVRGLGGRSDEAESETVDGGSAGSAEGGPSEAFLVCVAAIARFDAVALAEAAARLERDGLEECLVWHLCAYAQLAWNLRNPNGHESGERKGVRVANAYRIALGLPPLVPHPKAYEMASDYAEQMRLFGFLGHEHPSDETRRTPQIRARRIGYASFLGENCSSVAGGEVNIWRWRSDAGHHRTLIAPHATEVGLALSTRGVLNTGTGRDLALTPVWSAVQLP